MTCKIDYTANGSIVAFPFPFAVPAESALEVRVNDAVREVGFRVNCAGSADGGVVVFDSAPANGDVISLRYLGAVTIGVTDAAAGHLAEKLVAGSGVSLSTVTEDGGVQRLRISATDTVDALEKSANLSDLADKAAARANLGVYSKAETDALDQSVRDAALLKTGNLSGLTDKAAARANLEVYSSAQTDAAIAGAATTLSDQVLHKDQNLGDVASKGAARSNLEVYSKTEADAAYLAKSANLGDIDRSAALHNLGLDDVAYLNEAQNWTKPQRSAAPVQQSVGGSVTLDLTQAQNFDLSLTANASFANPDLSAVVGQKGTISIVPNSHTIAITGTAWKRVGDVGSPSVITGIGRIDYHVRSASRIEYAYNDVEA